MTNDDKDLKPCPFDGYKAVLAQSSDKTWFVMCLKCNCEVYGRDDGDDGQVWTKEAVIDYWNTRPTPQQPSEFMHFAELCEALGWQGGTIHQVIDEIKNLKAENEVLRQQNIELNNATIKYFDEDAYEKEFRRVYTGILSEETIEEAIHWNLNFMSKYVKPAQQLSENKALSREEILDLFQTFQLTVDEYREKDFPCIPEWNFTDLINAIHSALPAQREVRYPKKIYPHDPRLELPEGDRRYNQAIDEFKKLNGG